MLPYLNKSLEPVARRPPNYHCFIAEFFYLIYHKLFRLNKAKITFQNLWWLKIFMKKVEDA